MRIGIDGRELLPQRTGVGRYLAELCTQWLTSPRAGQHEFIVYTPESRPDLASLGAPFTQVEPERFRHRAVPGSRGTWWEQVQLPAAATQDALDVFFAPAYSLPLRLRVPTVVTMHDVSFSAHPEWFGWREGVRRRCLAQSSMARARAVISVSAFTQSEILRLFPVPAERIHVVRSGITPRTSSPTRTGEPALLFVGSLFNRRHLPTLIRAFARVLQVVPAAKLTVVGDDRTYPPQHLSTLVRETGTERQVSLRSYVSDEELDELYGHARVFVFLSEYEGFGLTPLEAMSAGVPVVVADTPVARELYEDAASFVAVADVRATARAVTALLMDDGAWEGQRRRGNALMPRFTWERAAGETLDVLECAAGSTA